MQLFQKHWKYKPARKSSDEKRKNAREKPLSIDNYMYYWKIPKYNHGEVKEYTESDVPSTIARLNEKSWKEREETHKLTKATTWPRQYSDSYVREGGDPDDDSLAYLYSPYTAYQQLASQSASGPIVASDGSGTGAMAVDTPPVIPNSNQHILPPVQNLMIQPNDGNEAILELEIEENSDGEGNPGSFNNISLRKVKSAGDIAMDMNPRRLNPDVLQPAYMKLGNASLKPGNKMSILNLLN